MLRSVLALLIALSAFADSHGDAPAARIVVECAGERCAPDGTLILREPGSGREMTLVLERGTADVRIPIDSVWEAELRAEGFWMPVRALPKIAPGDNTIRLPVWRTTVLTGRFVADAGANASIDTVRVGFESPPGTSRSRLSERHEVTCPIAEDGRWRCAVPAIPLDVVLRVTGFTPHYQWDVPFRPSRELSLGTIALRRGASVVAWLDGETRARLGKSVPIARLLHSTIADSSQVSQRLSRPVAEATFNQRGMVQLAPLPPGTYTVEIEAPNFAIRRVEPVEVYEGAESALRHLIALEPPVTVGLGIKPPQGPAGEPWRVRLFHADGVTSRLSPVASGETDSQGLMDLAGQAPGRYEITVRDARDNIFAKRTFTVLTDFDARQQIDLPLTQVQGTVSMGTQALSAALHFGADGGAERIAARSDERGHFEVTLPRLGKWRVDVEDRERDVIAAVEVVAKADEKLDIELPDIMVAGSVTRPDGTRTNGGTVVLHTSAGVITRPTNDDGTFAFRGVAAGTIRIRAHDHQTQEWSRPLSLEVYEGQNLPKLEIVLESIRELAGTVSSEGRPVIGARVLAYGFTGGGAVQERTISGARGEFSLVVPAKTGDLVLVVAAASRTLQAFRVRNESAADIDLASAGGKLSLSLSPRIERPSLTYNDVLLPLSDLFQWAHAHGATPSQGRLDVPNLAPGAYRLCGAEGHLQRCSSGFLARGGELELRLE